jgi:hypothetical protein
MMILLSFDYIAKFAVRIWNIHDSISIGQSLTIIQPKQICKNTTGETITLLDYPQLSNKNIPHRSYRLSPQNLNLQASNEMSG